MSQHPAAGRPGPHDQRGAGSLIVVMVLFFVMALVAAYSNRNIIFEQKTSANIYRAAQALEAAEAGVAWAQAMLNGGKIDDHCEPVATGGQSFRNRYLSINASTGVIAPVTLPYPIQCVFNSAKPTGWSCDCPTSASAASATLEAGTGQAPAFRLTFTAAGGRGLLNLRSQGCTRLDLDTAGCLATSTVSGGDAGKAINVTLALKGAVSSPPAAALTTAAVTLVTSGTPAVNGSVDFSATGASLVATNPEYPGIAIDVPAAPPSPAPAAAPATVTPLNVTVTGLPGTPPAAAFSQFVAQNDGRLPTPFPATISAVNLNDAMFSFVFGMARETYRQQPAAIVLTCPTDCTASNIKALADANPGRVLWLEGDASLNSTGAVDLGSPTAPLVIVSHGNLTVSGSPITVYGLLYVFTDAAAASGTWNLSGGLNITGAAIVEGNVTGAGTLNITYSNVESSGILRTLRTSSGSFVRVPGGWLDSN